MSIVFLVRVQCRRKESSRSLSHEFLVVPSAGSWTLRLQDASPTGQFVYYLGISPKCLGEVSHKRGVHNSLCYKYVPKVTTARTNH